MRGPRNGPRTPPGRGHSLSRAQPWSEPYPIPASFPRGRLTVRMSWKLKKKAQALVAAEEGVVRKDWGGRVSVALVYPNTYAVGMSNLGFQTIYEHLNALPDVVCERVFFPDPEDVDEYAPHRDRALLARVAPAADRLRRGRLLGHLRGRLHQRAAAASAWRAFPLRAADRGPGDPVVLMGGVCAFSNPEPHGALHGLRRGRRGRGAGGRDRRRPGSRAIPATTGGRAPLHRPAEAARRHLRARRVPRGLRAPTGRSRRSTPLERRRARRWSSSAG